MSDLRRWREAGTGSSAEAREILLGAARSRPMDRAMRASADARIAQLALVPATGLAVWLWSKKALAAAAVGVTTAAVVVVVVVASKAPHPARQASQPARAAHTLPAVTPPAALEREATPASAVPVSGDVPAVSRVLPGEAVAAATAHAREPSGPASEHRPAAVVSGAAARANTPSGHAVAVAPAVPAPPAEPPRNTLLQEHAMLERARAALADRPATALAELESHAATFPQGELSAEREFLAVDALQRLGRDADANARGEAFLAHFPHSMYCEHVRRLLHLAP